MWNLRIKVEPDERRRIMVMVKKRGLSLRWLIGELLLKWLVEEERKEG